MIAIDRDLARGRAAHARALASGRDAMSAAFAAIDATFPKGIEHRRLKNKVRTFFDCGPAHFAVWTRFEPLATEAKERDDVHCLAAARLHVEFKYRAEMKTRAVSLNNWGRYAAPRISAELLKEARLALRWVQRYAPKSYPSIRDAILYPEMMQQAAE